MSREEILAGIQWVASKHLAVHQTLRMDSDLIADLALDSLKQLTLIVEIENHFKICFEEGDEHHIATVGDLVTLIAQKRAP